MNNLGTNLTTRQLITYRRDDGEPIAGEYDFVTQLEWFEGDTEETRLVKETWIRIDADLVTVNHIDPDDDDED